MKKKLLIIYHTQSGNTGCMAQAVLRGAQSIEETETVMKQAAQATLEDLLACHGLLIGTPENFGYMAGMLKDFFDRTYYPAEGKMTGVPYAIFVSAGNDGTNAVLQVERIAAGYGWKKVNEAVIARDGVSEADLLRCEELGATLAAGIGFGIF